MQNNKQIKTNLILASVVTIGLVGSTISFATNNKKEQVSSKYKIDTVIGEKYVNIDKGLYAKVYSDDMLLKELGQINGGSKIKVIDKTILSTKILLNDQIRYIDSEIISDVPVSVVKYSKSKINVKSDYINSDKTIVTLQPGTPINIIQPVNNSEYVKIKISNSNNDTYGYVLKSELFE